jgi:hypothetical protein
MYTVTDRLNYIPTVYTLTLNWALKHGGHSWIKGLLDGGKAFPVVCMDYIWTTYVSDTGNPVQHNWIEVMLGGEQSH